MERLQARKRQSAEDRQSVQRRETVASVTNGAGLAGMASPLPTSGAATSAGLLSAACGVLDKLNRGVIIINAAALVLLANRAARAMLLRRSNLALDNGRLTFLPTQAATTLESYLRTGRGSEELGCLVLRLPCSQGERHYRVLISPLHTVQHAEDPSHCVLIYEPGGGQRPLPLDVLRELYGLTPAEARLVNALFTGQSLNEAARTFGVSVLTARTTLKRVFAKCEVSGQAELMLLVSLGPRTI